MKAKLVGLTSPTVDCPAGNAEELIAHCARVSSGRPADERHKDSEGLLRYCMRNAHWSIFEMADAVVELECPRDISRQAIRHRSFSFQEFSQRYSEDFEFVVRDVRMQDEKNRQNSIDGFDDETKKEFIADCNQTIAYCKSMYDKWRAKSAAKECCRVFLPEGLTVSRFYMKGSCRSWLHYLQVRDDPGVTQQEHVELAREISKVLTPAFSTVLSLRES